MTEPAYDSASSSKHCEDTVSEGTAGRDLSGKSGWNSYKPDYTNTPVSESRAGYGYASRDPDVSPCVTIITPFYNPGLIFEETAQSVLGQSFQQWEWIVVDDGSDDRESLELLERIASSDSRIRIVRQENRGLPGARNTGFREAQTEFVVQLDADDLIERTAVEKWFWLLISYPEYAAAKGYTVGFGSEGYVWRRGFHDAPLFFSDNLVTVTGMIRKSVHDMVGGYDESIVGGFEDWDYWLKIADAGHWGGTIPECLDWYRRRATHKEKWGNWNTTDQFRAELKKRYSDLHARGIKAVQCKPSIAWGTVSNELPCSNHLQKAAPRVLVLLPWMTLGGADRFNLDLIGQLAQRGYEISIATTLSGENLWEHEFLRYTSDVFVLERFLREADYPRFLRYLIESRGIDTVLITHSQLSYTLLPFLRAWCPAVTFVDYCHCEFEDWNNGGYPRFSVGQQSCLDLNVVSSEHLKRWMVARGASPQTIEVCYTSVDCDLWKPDSEARAGIRDRLEIPHDRTVLIYPARICDQKQPKIFAETIEKLRDLGRDLTVLVVGDGPDRGWLESFVSSHQLGGMIKVLGAVDAGEMGGLMAASDILFLPSKLEGIALSLFEAMASGVVVVGADVGGQRELVTPDCGFLLDREACPDEPSAYADYLVKLLDDPDLLAQLAQKSISRVRANFRLDHMGERMDQLLTGAVAQKKIDPGVMVDRKLGLESATAAMEYGRMEGLTSQLWSSREERIGITRTWRTAFLSTATRIHSRLPAPLQRLAVSMYRRMIGRR
jgi:glycosyltransferase involved in cell wall biosynthesis/GT2 family glycosyltransferase